MSCVHVLLQSCIDGWNICLKWTVLCNQFSILAHHAASFLHGWSFNSGCCVGGLEDTFVRPPFKPILAQCANNWDTGPVHINAQAIPTPWMKITGINLHTPDNSTNAFHVWFLFCIKMSAQCKHKQHSQTSWIKSPTSTWDLVRSLNPGQILTALIILNELDIISSDSPDHSIELKYCSWWKGGWCWRCRVFSKPETTENCRNKKQWNEKHGEKRSCIGDLAATKITFCSSPPRKLRQHGCNWNTWASVKISKLQTTCTAFHKVVGAKPQKIDWQFLSASASANHENVTWFSVQDLREIPRQSGARNPWWSQTKKVSAVQVSSCKFG